MIPDILTETLATIRTFDPNGDWHVPELPDDGDDLDTWLQYLVKLANLADSARSAIERMKSAARRV